MGENPPYAIEVKLQELSPTRSSPREAIQGWFQQRGCFHVHVWESSPGEWGLSLSEFSGPDDVAPLDWTGNLLPLPLAELEVWLDGFIEDFEAALSRFREISEQSLWECGEETPLNHEGDQ